MLDTAVPGETPVAFTLRPDVQPLDVALAEEKAPEPIMYLPRGRRVLVDLCDVRAEEAVHSRIFTDATVDGAIEYGVVRSVGPMVEDQEIRVGAVVMFGKFSGYGMQDESAMVLRDEDVMMVVRGGVVRLRTEREARAAEEVRATLSSRGIAESARIVPAGADWRNEAAHLDGAHREMKSGKSGKQRNRKRRGY